MDQQQIIKWLLEGDVSIQYQVWRDLLGEDKKHLQQKIAHEGWGKKILSKRNANGHWGDRFYQPKWTSTHYTLLDLRNLNLPPDNEIIQETLELIFSENMAADGGIQLGPSTAQYSDICVNGMFVNYASYFNAPEKKLHPVVDCIMKEIMPDGGFNCRTTRSGARHSSLHSTISVVEGLTEFQKSGSKYQSTRIKSAIQSATEFILMHRLFMSDHTGAIISKDFLKFTYPCRWRYDILRALDYWQYAGLSWDSRLQESIDVLRSKRNKQGTWNMPSQHAGQVHLKMEQAGRPGRWNTLRAWRILRHFGLE